MTNQQDFLMQNIVSDIIGYIMEDNSVDITTAVKTWAESEFSDKLQDEETGLYLEGSAYVYELFKEWQNKEAKP